MKGWLIAVSIWAAMITVALLMNIRAQSAKCPDGGSPYYTEGLRPHSSRDTHPDNLNVWGTQVDFGAQPSPYLYNPGLPPMVGPLALGQDAAGGWQRRSQVYTVSTWFFEQKPEDAALAEAFLHCIALRGYDRAAKGDCE